MKARHKQLGYTIDFDKIVSAVIEQLGPEYERLDEPRSVEQWKDCTAECHINSEGVLYWRRDEDDRGAAIMGEYEVREGYRLRLNRLWRDGEAGFKVEKKMD